MKRLYLSSVMLTLSSFAEASSAAAPGTYAPSGSIERKYYADGPARPLRFSSEKCDRRGHVCDVWYPSDIAQGRPRAVVLWANGTSDAPVEPKVYDYLLAHLATWGFVVIATRDPKTGYGDTVLDSLDHLKRLSGDGTSPLYHRIDVGRVGVAGHSQGATGAINAMLKSNGAVKTSVAFQLPRQIWCSPADLCVKTEDLKAAKRGSIFYVGGTFDVIISPDRQLFGGKLNSLTAYYDATPDGILKAKALVELANHNDILGKPSCATAEQGGGPLTCTLGVYGYLGLPTAWLAWQLQGAGEAGAAFRSRTGELFSARAWSGQKSNVP
jgi:hypothetical protein